MSILDALGDTDLLTGETPSDKANEEAAEETKKEVVEEVKSEETEETKVETEVTPVIESVKTEEEPEKKSEEVIEEAKANKIKVEYLDFLDKHKDVIVAYQSEKTADYSKLTPEEILTKSLSIKYPNLSKEEIADELQGRYGVGVNTEDLDSGELIAHKAKQRKLKIEAQDSLEVLNKYRDSLVLPDFELDIPAPTTGVKTTEVNVEEVIQQKQKESADADAKWRAEEWTPAISKAVSGLSKLSQEVDMGGTVGKVNIEIELDESDKSKVKDFLSKWVYHPSDNDYAKDGNVDLEGFTKARAALILSEKFAIAAGNAAINKYKEEHIKNNVVNFNQEAKNNPITQYEEEGLYAITDKLRAK